MRMLVIGGCSVDTIIKTEELKIIKDDMSIWSQDLVETIGGTGAGKALCLDALGHDVSLVTSLGLDQNRDKIIQFFENTNVQIYQVVTNKTETHTNIMHGEGNRISIFTNVPDEKPKLLETIEILLSRSDIVLLNINDFCRDYIPIIKQYQKKIVVDIHDYEVGNPYHQDFIDCADIIIASSVNLNNHIEFLENVIDSGKELGIVTFGINGAVAMNNQKGIFKTNSYTNIEYVDSNGAGDSFISGFITEYLKTKNVGESLKIGALCGAYACTSFDLYNTKYGYNEIKEIKKIVDF